MGPGNSTQLLKISGKCLSLLSEHAGFHVFVLPTFFYLFYISSSHSWPCIPDPSALPPEWGNYGYAQPRLLFPDIFYLVSPAVSVLSLHMALLTTEQLVALLCPTKIKLLFLEMLCKAPLMQQILRDFSSEMLEAR